MKSETTQVICAHCGHTSQISNSKPIEFTIDQLPVIYCVANAGGLDIFFNCQRCPANYKLVFLRSKLA